nr:MAG TPA: Putative apramycin biosynthetic oxidoreductase 4 SAM, FeS-cluster containing enzyme [Caudoviricetes sp.]
MRISAYHKARGDIVEWWWSDFVHYDIVYMSKIFSDAYSPDVPAPINADKVVKGGTGYAIHLQDGKEVFNKEEDKDLPAGIEKMFPDYSIYPQFPYAVSMTSRGCPRGCAFCHVAAKEGRCSIKVANVSDFWCGQDEIKVLDSNITACRDKRDLMQQYVDTKAKIDFTQGLDIRLLNQRDIEDLNKMRIGTLHFAWDNPQDDLKSKFQDFAKGFRRKTNIGTVYCLTNFNSTLSQDLYRIYTLRDLGYDPFVMVYNKPAAPKEIRRLQRWCNNKIIFKSTTRFEDYNG